MLVEADALVAKKLFFPIIIGVCRLSGITQYGFASYASVLSVLCIVPLIMGGGSGASLLGQCLMLGFVATMLAYHAMRPELVRPPRGFWKGIHMGYGRPQHPRRLHEQTSALCPAHVGVPALRRVRAHD